MLKKKFWCFAVVIVSVLILGYIVLLLLNSARIAKLNYVNLTDEQKDEDMLYLNNVLDEAYPFTYEIEQSGIDPNAIFTDFRSRIKKAGNDTKFYERIGEYLSRFGGLGHLGVVGAENYQLFLDTYREAAPESMATKMLEEELTTQAYTVIAAATGVEMTEATAQVPVSNLEVKIMNEFTAYMKIPSFLYQNIEADRERIFNFYREIEGLDHLIIDIRGNGGGSGLYWQELIVRPNVKQDTTQISYAAFKEHELFMPLLREEIPDGSIKLISQLPDFSNPSYDYATLFTHFIEVEDIYLAADNPFAGSIWVLVDEAVYSSSENFAMFCKDTGFATLVGQATNGDGGLMNPVLFTLPNSGLLCRFSYLYRLNSDGSSNELVATTPDILVESSKDSLEVCLSDILSKPGTNRSAVRT